jgi:hypothetical protein
LLQGKLKAGPAYKVLYNIDWYQNEDFYKKENETPKFSWALVTKETISNTKSKNYLEQTELLLAYAKTMAEDNTPFKQALDEAEMEFNQIRPQIASLIDTDWQKAADLLVPLNVTKLLRHTPAEIIYDILIRLQNNTKDEMTKGEYIWTATRSSGGDFVCVGFAGADGVDVSWDQPDRRHSNLGASLSRSV